VLPTIADSRIAQPEAIVKKTSHLLINACQRGKMAGAIFNIEAF
jgi:hypothetical protein